MQTETTDNAECFNALMHAAYHIQHGNTGAARDHLSSLLEIKPDPYHCAGDVQTVLFASALMKTCGGGNTDGGNIYTRNYTDRQIDLFNLITKSFPDRVAFEADRQRNPLRARSRQRHALS